MAIQLGHGVKSEYFSVRLINFLFFSLTCVSLINPAFYVNLSPHYYTDPRMKVVSILWAVPVPRTTCAVGHYGFFVFFMPRTYRVGGSNCKRDPSSTHVHDPYSIYERVTSSLYLAFK
jgi:hypothetical protein